MDISVRSIGSDDRDKWFEMRKGIWPETPDNYLIFDMDRILASENDVDFIAFSGGDLPG